MIAALSVFYLLKLLAAEPCYSVVINDPVKKETVAYKCILPKKDAKK
jgi:hypothetical protein